MVIVLPQDVLWILKQLETRGYRGYAVGGCVRDSLMGREPKDWDIATSAKPEETMGCFPGQRVIPTGLQHGTVTVVLHHTPYEITTFRIDGAYSDNRRPDSVVFTGELREDLSRRDFTVNALAYHPETGLVDHFQGLEDLRRRRIRCVGNPGERFQEDALRILRAARFSSALDFSVEDDTRKAMEEQRGLLGNIAAERIAAELNRLLMGPGVGRALAENELVLRTVLPELEGFPWREQTGPVPLAEGDLAVRLALLLRHLAAEGADGVLRRLKYDNATRNAVAQLLGAEDTPPFPDERAMRRLLHCLAAEGARRLLAYHGALARWKQDKEGLRRLHRAQEVLQGVLEQGQCYRLRDLAVKGADLLELGAVPGVALGRLLQLLLDRVLDGELPNRREALLAAAKKELERE